MLRLLTAVVLSAGLHSAMATTPTPSTTAARAPDTIVQAQLSLPGDRPSAVRTAAPATKDPKQGSAPDGGNVLGMLLAAVGLITGIAIRRWGTGLQ